MSKTRKRVSPDQRRRMLLNVALKIVAQEGFDALQIARLSKEAGVARPLIYHYFNDREGVVQALVERETEVAMAEVLESLEAISCEPEKAIVELFLSIVAMADNSPLTWKILLNPPSGGPSELYSRIEEGKKRAHSGIQAFLLEHIYQVLKDQGEDIKLTARMIQVLLEEALRMYLHNKEENSVIRMAKQLERFTYGIFEKKANKEEVQ